MKILVTGAAGFIGSFTSVALVQLGHEVTGVDNLNSYYDINLKKDRLRWVDSSKFNFIECDLTNNKKINKIFKSGKFDVVINLAAQAGVRYSIDNPHAYVDSNISGFINILEACRHFDVGNLIYASSSSVYGMNSQQPFSVKDAVAHPVSLYAATKKSNELMAHAYSHLYKIPTTGLRFFTVYGPWGRPDMAYFTFTRDILARKPIKVFNNGEMRRDFTYIDDIVEAVVRLTLKPATAMQGWDSLAPDASGSSAPYRIYNIGNNNPVSLGDFIATIEAALGVEAIKNYLPMQQGDVISTYADIDALVKEVDYQPKTSLKFGIERFVEWYLPYFGHRH